MKYQVVIIGPGAKRYRALLEQRLRKRIRDLSPLLPNFLRFIGSARTTQVDPKAPVVGVYFGGRRKPVADVRAVQYLLGFSSVILPVVSDLSRFRDLVPRELHGINGVPRDHSYLDAIINFVLENLGLLRRSRRLFVSYRRSDSSEAALQLRHELDARNYDIFLDTHSVMPGDQFQEVLWQRLVDSDVMLLLDSPGFLASRWTREELAQAQAMTVGILQIVWPHRTPVSYSDLCERMYLKDSDFTGRKLRAATLERIAAKAETLRARSLGARHDNLVREFCDAANRVGTRTIVQPGRYILATLPTRRRIAVVPSVGVLDAFRYHETSRRFTGHGHRLSAALLVYDHRGLRPEWKDYLEWLDQFLPVKAIRITDVGLRLPTL